MRNTFGNAFTVTLFGESHGPGVGLVADGLPGGLAVSRQEIAKSLSRRRPAAAGESARREADNFEILSGEYAGYTTGSPFTIYIPNTDQRSGDYENMPARPSHADYTAHVKYGGFEDRRGGGHFSGRLTAPLAALGGVLLPALREKGITIGTHILSCGGICDRHFENAEEDIKLLAAADYPVLSREAGERMRAAIESAALAGDSLGGITESAVFGLPAGLGEPLFDSAEGVLSHILFSIGGIKGVGFGAGFRFGSMRGSEANDPLRLENGRVVTKTNNNGGINGGITNGMPVLFSCAVKPTPSVSLPQRTVDIGGTEEVDIMIKGRHDAAIVRRICPVIDAAAAIALWDMLAVRYGTDFAVKGFRE